MTVIKSGFKQSTILLIFALSLFVNGCSNMVTSKNTLLTIKLTLELNGNIDTINNNYIFVLSVKTPKFPDIPDYIYFPTPGAVFKEDDYFLSASYQEEKHKRTVEDGDISYYYEKFYSTWTDFIIIRDGEAKVYKSNSTNFGTDISTLTQNTTIVPDNSFNITTSISENVITLIFNTQELSQEPTPLYFSAATTAVSDGTDTGYIKDIFEQSDTIFLSNGEQEFITDDINEFDVPDEIDIIELRAEIF